MFFSTAARAELSRGHPAKEHRVIVHPSDPAPLPKLELPFLGAPRGRDVADDSLATSAVDTRVRTLAPKQVGTYLPTVGPAALRFAAVNAWPAPLAAKTSTGTALVPAGAQTEGAAPGAEPADGVTTPSPVAPGAVPHRSTTITAESRAGSAQDGPRVLGVHPLLITAELVLDHIDNLPRSDGPDAPRFRPAIPSATPPPGPLAPSSTP